MRSNDQDAFALTLVTFVSLALFLSAVTFLALDVFYWIKYATWSATKIADAFRYCGIREPYFVEWRGLRELWGYLREAPLSLFLLVIWFLFTGVAGSLFGSTVQHDSRGGSPGRGRRR